MPDLLADLPFLFAQNAPPAAASPWSSLLPLLPIPILFYFLMIRPKQLEDRKRQAMIDALKRNDRVITTAGIYGTVVSLDTEHDRVVLRVDDDRGVKLTFSRSSVLKVVEVSQEKGAKPAAPDLREDALA
jgi:preprotein translocase subunit YajC